MKALVLISLVLNAVLMARLGFAVKKGEFTQTPKPSTAQIFDAKTARESVSTASEPYIVTNTVFRTLDWSAVESDDYNTYIQNLRAIGCPEETVRDIVAADVKKLFRTRLESTLPKMATFEYWKPGNPYSAALSPERLSKTREIQAEQRALLQKLIGGDSEHGLESQNPVGELLPFLNRDQLEKIDRIRQDYKSSAMQEHSGASRDKRERLASAELKMNDELSRILRPEEKEAYDLYFSATAAQMRSRLASFAPSEEEFRTLFQIRKALEDARQRATAIRDPNEQDPFDLEAEFVSRAKQRLSADRFNDFLRTVSN